MGADNSLSLVGFGKNPKERPDTDFYSTPPYAVSSLLKRTTLVAPILEPAAGENAIVDVLQNGYGFTVTGRDITQGQDFLKTKGESWRTIITNPPYRYAEDFLKKALELTDPQKGEVFLLLKLQFLEGQKRKELFETTPLREVMVFSKRITFWRNGKDLGGSGMMAFAWYWWDWRYKGNPTISWL